MTRKHPSRRRLVISGAAIFLSSLVTVSAQEAPAGSPQASSNEARTSQRARGRNLAARATSRAPRRSVIKIKTRAEDTLSLLADRFGVSADDIAQLNGVAVGATLVPGGQLMIPLPSNRPSAKADRLAQHTTSARVAEDGGIPADAGNAWENVQGVLFRKQYPTVASDPNPIEDVTLPARVEAATSRAASSGTVVEVSEAEKSSAAVPVWIYLVGGARVEADSVNETPDGVWYKRGNLTIFIERSRIDRIERERAVSVSDDAGSWKERGWSTGNPKFDGLIRQNAARFGVDPYLIFCVMEQESQFRPRAVSPAGARGLMQLMPGTAAYLGVRRIFDPADNIMGGTKYLKQLLANFKGRVDLVLAGYNAGEGAVKKYGGRVPPYKETRDYVRRISKRYGQNRSIAPAVATAVPAALDR